ncbi:MAG: SCO family protein [Thermoleophilaceae bacterium]|nr:SCO family protein [Thermoleophilaceae bacterium]
MTGPHAPRWPLVALVGVAVLGTALAGYLFAIDRPESSVAIVEGNSGPFRGNRLPPEIVGSRAPKFELADAEGGRLSTAQLAGEPYIVTFLYANCPDVCPLIADELRQTLALLGPDAERPTVVAVSVDPKGDTAAVVRDFRARHRLPENFRYLIGTESELKPVWDSYYAAPQIPGRADSAHSASIWLIDGDGRIRTKFSGGFPLPPADIAHDLQLLIDEQKRPNEGARR